MTIVHIISYFQHQLGYQEYFIAKEQVKAGHKVYVLTSERYFPFPNYEKAFQGLLGPRIFDPKEEVIEGIIVKRLPVIFEQPAKRVILKGLLSELKSIKPNLVHVHGEYTFFVLQSILWKKKLGYSLVVDSHCHPHDVNNEYKSRNLVKYFLSKTLHAVFSHFAWKRKNIHWVATTAWNRIFITERCKIPVDRIKLIANGSEINKFKPDIEVRKKVREKLGISGDEVVIIYTGKISERKGIDKIMRIQNEIISEHPFILLLIGNIDPTFSNSFLELKKPINNNVIHIGMVPNDDLPQYYQISDIGCWPTESSMSAIDALACGLPIIVCKELEERLKFENGIGITEGSINELKNAFIRLISDKELREGMGRKGTEVLIRAFKQFLLIHPEYKLILVGFGSKNYLEYIYGIINELNLENSVEFKGKLSAEKIKEMHNISDIFVYPSFIENSPNSVAEAMVSGLPIITTNVGGIPSMITNNHDGFLIPSNDIDALAKKMIEVAGNPSLKKGIGDNARITGLERHLPRKVGEISKDIYIKIINQEV